MGVSVLYSAIPPKSTLYARLQEQRAFMTLMVSLFPYGCGIFRFFEIEPDEVEEILEWVIEEHQDTFGAQLEARRWIDAFRLELERTRIEYPGIEDRTALMEKSSTEIEERLVKELTKKHVEDAREFVSKLMFGDRTLSPNLLSAEDSLGLISLSMVQIGAKILQAINPNDLFTSDESWYLNDFNEWKHLYLLAAEHQEEILVMVA